MKIKLQSLIIKKINEIKKLLAKLTKWEGIQIDKIKDERKTQNRHWGLGNHKDILYNVIFYQTRKSKRNLPISRYIWSFKTNQDEINILNGQIISNLIETVIKNLPTRG